MADSLFDQALKLEGITGAAADFAKSIYHQESSSGTNTQTSNAGATGGMQIIPSTFKSVADKGWNISNPLDNARAGIRYATKMFNKADSDPAIAAAGYYGGTGALMKAKKGIAVSDPRNPNAPTTLEYGQQVVGRMPDPYLDDFMSRLKGTVAENKQKKIEAQKQAENLASEDDLSSFMQTIAPKPASPVEAQPTTLLGDVGQGVKKFGQSIVGDGGAVDLITGLQKAAYGAGEAIVGGALGTAKEAAKGIYGTASGLAGLLPKAIGGGGGFEQGYEQGSQAVENLIPSPQMATNAGQAIQQIMGAPGAELHRGGQGAGAWVEDKTGSKVAGGLAASLFETAGNAAMMGLPLKGKVAPEIVAAERTRQQITDNPPEQFTQPIQAAERPTAQQAALATTPEGLAAQAETMSSPVVEVGKPAVHVSNGVETPVVVKNIEQAISDGKTYARVEHEGGVSVVPVEELSPVSKLTPETPISVAAEQTATVAPNEAVSAPTGTVEVGQPAIWRSGDSDTPVVVKNIEQQAGSDGKTYARVEINGKDSFIPADELVATIDSTKPIEPMTNATTVNVPKASELPLQELASTARTSTEGIIGKKSARETLAEQASPSAPVVAAAERLGILDSLQPDHLTTNQSFRELSQAIKSYVGSPLRSAELEGLQQVATRADKIITDLGADKDVSSLSQKVKTEMQSTIDDLQSHARTMYDGLRDKVPPTDLVTAPKTLDFIQQRATNLGGETYLSPIEKTVLARLSDKSKPTYARLDDVRRDLTAAKYKNQGAFKDADSYLIDQIESTLKEDQRSALGEIAKRNGLDPAAMIADFDLAQKTAAAYKGMQSRMITLFGKQLDGNIARSLKNAVNGLSIGDTKSFVNIINSIPENMRGEAVANGLAYAFERNAGAINHNTFSNFWNGIKRQGEANKLLKQYLPPESYNALNDLGIVSESISKASKERIVTGRLNVVNETLKEADTWIGKLYEKAKAGAGQAAGAEAISSTMGAPGAGIAIGAVMAVLKDKPPIHLAIDKLLGSKEFRDAVATKSKMEALRGQK